MPRLILVLCLMLATPLAALPVQRCVNLGNALDAPREGDWGYVVNEPDLDWIAAQGFDTIRLPVRFDAHWQAERGLDPALLARVDQVITWARARGLRVIVDFHHFEGIHLDPDRYAPVYLAIWAELARHFAGAPDDVMLELLNEPNSALTTDRMAALNGQILADLRPLHPNRWVIVSGAHWGSLPGYLEYPDPGPFTAVSVHYYDPFDFTHQNAFWVEDPPPARGWGTARERLQVAEDMARVAARGVPVLLGEFGAYQEIGLPLRTDWTGTVRRAAERHDIGWCIWALEAGFRLRGSGGDWLPGMRDALFGE